MASVQFMGFLLSQVFLVTNAFIDFRLTTEDPNHLTLECYSSVTGDIDDGATIYFFNSQSEGAQWNISSGQTFDVTPGSEGFFLCTDSDGTESEFVAIAGEGMHTGNRSNAHALFSTLRK